MTRIRLLGGVCGVLAALAGLGAAEGTAALLDGPSPIIAVGTWAIDVSPQWLTKWAIATFGVNDKTVLVAGVTGTVALLGALAGLIGVHRPRIGVGLTVGLGLVGLLAATTVRGATDAAAVRAGPALVALIVGTGGLAWMLDALRPREPDASSHPVGPLEVGVPAAGPDQGELRGSGAVLSERPVPPASGSPASADQPERPAVIIPGRRPGAAALDRRAFVRAVGAVGVVGLAGGGLWQWQGTGTGYETRGLVRLPAAADTARRVSGADLRLPGLSPYFTANRDFYRVDTALVVPQLDSRTWRLKIHGMVEKPLTLTFDDLLRARLIERDITLTCVSNEIGGDLVGNARWLGVPIRDVLALARPRAGADAVKSTSVDGWTAGTPLSALTDPKRDAMLAIGMNGEPLPYHHGFPVRMVVPGLYGFVSATKWVTEIEVTRYTDFEAYWTQRDWAVQAPIKTQSRIELPVPYSEIKPGRTVVAGVAWAQHRGISKVEVQIGEPDAPWRTATLAPWNNVDTWRQWRLEWNAPDGTHNLAVRATDGTGEVQTFQQTPPIPDGAAGHHNVLSQVVL